MTQPTLDGPRLGPASGRAPRRLVVLLHGYGADGNDLIGLAEPLSQVIPDAAFAAPHAPAPCREAPMGRQWFDLTLRDPAEYVRGVAAAMPAIARFVASEAERHAVEPNSVALVGFSQGTMMALGTALLGGAPIAGVIGFSGLLAVPAETRPEDVAAVPTLLVHGTADEVVPAERTIAAAARLAELGCPVEWHLRPGIGHGIDPVGLDMAADYLAKLFAS